MNRAMVNGLNRSKQLVIVTGCDSGIGLELSHRVVSWGFHLVACCHKMNSGGAKLLLENKKVDVLPLDVTCEQSVNEMKQSVEDIMNEQNKVVWALVNNAGVMDFARTEWLDWQLTQAPLLVNLAGTIQTTRLFLPLLRKNRGRVINVSSPQGRIASPMMTLYCGSKWGVEGFSQALRREVGGQMDVVVVRPYNAPLQTSLLRANEDHLDQMWSKMDPRLKQEYEKEFQDVASIFKNNFSNAKQPQRIEKDLLVDAFKQAITSECPRRTYDAAPLVVRAFFSVVERLPVWLTDLIVRYEIHLKVIGWA